jgi:hypothetical protein
MSDRNVVVQFDNIVVNAMETNAGVFVGTNVQYGWSSHNKTNASMTGISGESNEVVGNVNIIYDNDFIDTSIDDRDVMLSSSRSVKAS